MTFGSAVATQLLTAILLGGTVDDYGQTIISLHTAAPGAAGANEVTGGSYARGTPTWGAVQTSAAGGGTCYLGSALDFPGLPAGTVTHFGIWTAGTSFINGGALTAGQVVAEGGTVTLGTATAFQLS